MNSSIKPVAVHLLSAFGVFFLAVIVGTLFSTSTLVPPSSTVMLATTATAPTVYRDAYNSILANSYTNQSGTQIGGTANDVGWLSGGDWLQYGNVQFGEVGALGFVLSIAVDPALVGQKIEVHLDSQTGTKIATINTVSTGSFSIFQDQMAKTGGKITGLHDVYLVMVGGDGIGSIRSFKFTTYDPTTTTAAPATADMVVTDIQLNPSTPIAGQAVTFSATIKNQGTVATPAGIKNGVAFSVDAVNVSWSDDNTSSIPPGGSVTVTANSGPSGSATWTATAGTHNIDAWVNDATRYAETTMTNNQFDKSFTVASTAATPPPSTAPAPSPSPTTAPAPTPTAAVTPSTAALVPVTFSVVVASGLDSVHCDKGYPETEVYFGADPIAGGEFYLQSTNGFSAKFEPGIYPFPNGSYHWTGDARTGYSRSGIYENDFTLTSKCPSGETTSSSTLTTSVNPPTTTTTTTTTTRTATAPVPAPSPAPTTAPTTVSNTTKNPAPAPVSPSTTSPTPSPVTTKPSPQPVVSTVVTKELASCGTAEECAQVCTGTACAQFARSEVAVSPATPSTEPVGSGESSVPVLDERVGVRAFVDTDGDGISDYDEVNIYHTDPKKKDTDGDGVSDGDELLARTDPLMFNSANGTMGTSTVKEATTTPLTLALDPRESGAASSVLKVENVAPLEHPDNVATSTKILHLSGRAIPNAFITLYIFSEPIVVVVKADDTGAWTYTLDKELPDGAHQVYSAITDASGKIIAKSEPLPFVKEAQAITIGVSGAPVAPEEVAPSFFSGMPVYASVLMLIGLLGVALTIIGLIVRRRGDSELPLGPA